MVTQFNCPQRWKMCTFVNMISEEACKIKTWNNFYLIVRTCSRGWTTIILIEWIINFLQAKRWNSGCQHDIHYPIFFAIVDVCTILFHRQEYEIEKLHWKFEVNYSSTFWDIAFTMTVIGHFQTFEKNSFNYVPKYLRIYNFKVTSFKCKAS